MAGGAPTMPGQDAFAAIAEIVGILEADPTTDWTKVDIERLRQHLIDMNEVMLRAAVSQTSVPGGLAMDITGTGRTEQAIRARWSRPMRSSSTACLSGRPRRAPSPVVSA